MRQPLPPRAHAALLAVALRLDAAGVRWMLAGSAGRALQGHRVRPRDIDIEVPHDDVADAGRALGVALVRAAGGGCSSLRAVTRIGGVEVDVTGGLVVEGPWWRLPASDVAQLSACTSAQLGDHTITLAPVEESIARALVLGDRDRVQRIASGALAGGPGVAAPRLDYVVRRLSSAIARAAR